MTNLLIAVIIGFAAGVVDIIPMIIKKLDRRDTISAFVHYFALGLIIPFVNWPIPPWIKGLIIALITAIPIIIIVYPKDRKAIFPMIVFSLVLGASIGIAGAEFIG